MTPIDIFLCYRRAGAQTAKLFKRYLKRSDFPYKVWYSDEEVYGNFKNDIPRLIDEAQCVVMFADTNFTKGFLDPQSEQECITALEIAEIERKMQRDDVFRMIIVFLDRPTGFTVDEAAIFRQLFQKESICDESCLGHFMLSNAIQFNTAVGDEDLLFEKISQSMLPDQFYKAHRNGGNFYFGIIPTFVDLVICDMDKGIEPSDFCFEMESEEIPLYKKIDRMRSNLVNEIQNNQMLSFIGLSAALSDDLEKKLVTIRYVPIEYKLFFKTLMLWDSANLNLNRILSTYDLERDIYTIPNAMGMAFMVVTSDGKLVFTQRSANRRVRPGEYDCSIVEGLKPNGMSDDMPYDSADEDYLFFEARRAYHEEICANESIREIKLIGVALDKEYGQWNVIGTIFAGITAEDMVRRHAVRADTYEKHGLEFVSYLSAEGKRDLSELKKKLEIYIQGKMWGMALVTLYATLKLLGFNDEEIKQLSDFYQER